MAEAIKIDFKSGKQGGNQKLNDRVFNLPLRLDILNEYVIMQNRTKRAGTHATQTRTQVTGTGKKPFRQKGTGNARQGSLKGPHQIGGGVAFGPQPRTYKSRLNKSTKRKAIALALSQKRYDKTLFVSDSFVVESGKTKDALKKLSSIEAKSVLVVGNFSEETWRSLKNVKTVKLLEPQVMNVKDILKFKACVLTTEALSWIEENLAPNLKGEAA